MRVSAKPSKADRKLGIIESLQGFLCVARALNSVVSFNNQLRFFNLQFSIMGSSFICQGKTRGYYRATRNHRVKGTLGFQPVVLRVHIIAVQFQFRRNYEREIQIA